MSEKYRKCAKCGASPHLNPTLSFHSFPRAGKASSLERLRLWANYCFPDGNWSAAQLSSLHKSHKLICSKHFDPSAYTDKHMKRLNPNAVPKKCFLTVPGPSQQLLEFPVTTSATQPPHWKANNITNVVHTQTVPEPLEIPELCIASDWADGDSDSDSDSARIRYLTQTEAAELDQDLFNEYKFSVDQLMELAGLSIAKAVAMSFPPSTHQSSLVVCGPGNNGGDGLVAARYMAFFGYTVTVYYPKRTPKPLYENLLEQCKRFRVNIVEQLPSPKDLRNDYQVLIDALFGFSFKPPVRDELKPALNALVDSRLPVCSVDIPSGWNVEKGPDSEKALKPAMLISLSAPKLCARPEILDNAKHFLGGMFLPPEIITKYNLTLPHYPGQEQVVQLSC